MLSRRARPAACAGSAGPKERSCTAAAAASRADFNGDSFGDLAIGVPGEDVNGVNSAGAVNVIYGSPVGLSATAGPGNQFLTTESVGLGFTSFVDDRFGSSLAAGDFNGDGRGNLAVGLENEDVGTIQDAGAVYVIYGSQSA